jgi:hypothetical protein
MLSESSRQARRERNRPGGVAFRLAEEEVSADFGERFLYHKPPTQGVEVASS